MNFKVLKIFLIWIIVPIVFFILFETGLRISGYGYSTDFFLEKKINGQTFLVNNDRFTWQYYAPYESKQSEWILTPAQKPPDIFRIVVLGESAALGDPDYTFGFSKMLWMMLEQHTHGKAFEVINTSITAINSHTIVKIAEECAQKLDPDLFIVYMGNNEVVGPFGPGQEGSGIVQKPAFRKMIKWYRQTKTYQLTSALNFKFFPPSQAGWQGMEMFSENTVFYDDPRLTNVYKAFEENVATISQIASQHKIPLILSTVAVNLKDQAPFASNGGEVFKGDTISINLASANENYVLASRAFKNGEYDKAREHFTLARDKDGLRFRADSKINQIIRQFKNAPNVYLLDSDSLFHTLSESGIPGNDFFWEHVHFNFNGNYHLAAFFYNHISENIIKVPVATLANATFYKQVFGYTVWDHYRIVQAILQRSQKPPFTACLNHKEQIEGLTKLSDESKLHLDATPHYQIEAIYQQAYETTGYDRILYNYATFMSDRVKNYSQSISTYEYLMKRYPDNYHLYTNLGFLQLSNSQFEAGLKSLDKAIDLNPYYWAGWYNLGLYYFHTHDYSLAYKHLKQAYRLNTHDPRIKRLLDESLKNG